MLVSSSSTLPCSSSATSTSPPTASSSPVPELFDLFSDDGKLTCASVECQTDATLDNMAVVTDPVAVMRYTMKVANDALDMQFLALRSRLDSIRIEAALFLSVTTPVSLPSVATSSSQGVATDFFFTQA